ncbi:MAG: DUF547 domain-containing protein [Tsuneonella sp.]
MPALAATEADFSQFAPSDDRVATRLDFSVWDTALNWFVLRMGPSLREYAPRPDRSMGTNLVYGHDSPYRLEGNRVAFSLMTDDMRQAVAAYRRELQELPDTVPLARLSRNEQLAFWINLHNAAMIEAIAQSYPVKSPSVVRFEGSMLPLDETPFIEVAGVKMSPRDIRTRIVYPNWRDPIVMYGFWHGEIGGPSLSRNAFTADNLGEELGAAAREFVNSLRGTQKSGDRLLVSRLYLEGRPHYFSNWPQDLRAHLLSYSDDNVAALIGSTSQVDASIVETDIADLSKGEREPEYTNIVSEAGPTLDTISTGVIGRLLAERKEKIDRIVREAKVTVDDSEGNTAKRAVPEEIR